MENNQQTPENVIAGIVGAFLFSLAGGLIYYGLYQLGFIASIAGLVGVVLAIKGYSVFAKKESIKGVIIAFIVALLVLVLAWYLCMAQDIYKAYHMWFEEGEVDYAPTFGEACRAVPAFLREPEIGPAYIKDLALSLVFALVGGLGTVITTIKTIKNKRSIPSEATYSPTEGNTDGPNSFETAAAKPSDSPILRTATTDEKVKILAQADAFGHRVIFRKVGKKTEELVIDNAVYAEREMGVISKAYSMMAIVDGHIFTVGMYRVNYIEVDGVRIATSTRWI